MNTPLTLCRTPVKWLKFRPEKPMGEIQEEGDKDEGEKKEGVEGDEGADRADAAARINEDSTAVKEV